MATIPRRKQYQRLNNPDILSNQITTAITTTTLSMVFIVPSIGILELTNQSRTPIIIRITTILIISIKNIYIKLKQYKMKKVLWLSIVAFLASFTFKNKEDDILKVVMWAYKTGWEQGNNSGISGTYTWPEDSIRMVTKLKKALNQDSTQLINQ